MLGQLRKKSIAIAMLFFLSIAKQWYIITARSAVYIIKGGVPPLYLITHQRASAFAMMICNFFEIDDIPQQVADDIHGCAVMGLCFAQTKLRQAANDVMLRINDVGFRPTMLREAQTRRLIISLERIVNLC